MKITIVGNGEGVLRNDNGNFIDQCDYVVRMKNFKIRGFEKHVGTKINIFSSKWFSWFDRNTSERLHFDFLDDIQYFLFMFFDPNNTPDLSKYNTYLYISEYSKYQLQNEYPSRIGSPTIHNSELDRFGIDHDKVIYMTPDEIYDISYNILKINDFYRNDVKFKSIIEPTVGIRTIYKIIHMFPNAEIFITGFDGFTTKWYWDTSHKVNNSHYYLQERIYLKYLTNSKRVTDLDE